MPRMERTQRQSPLARLFARLGRKDPEPAAKHSKSSSKSSKSAATPALPFQAVSIYRGIKSCEIAKRFSDHRFLAKEAPQLPLSGCTMNASCECRYLKHKDRRGAPRRLIEFGLAPRLFDGKERRTDVKRSGRRRAD
jgi:hypothetical protein